MVPSAKKMVAWRKQMHILLTAYGSFPGVPENITGKVADAIQAGWNRAENELSILRLPVEWHRVKQLLKQALEQLNPDVAISLGHAEKYSSITVETRYFNIAEGKDNKGEMHTHGLVELSGPSYYDTNVAIAQLAAHLANKKVPAVFCADGSAVLYLCNFAGYVIMHCIKNKKIQKPLFIFLHLPPHTLPFPTLVRGVKEVINFFISPA